MPIISIIAPVYNVEYYLGYCIDSILSQKFDDYELLLIDDGSTDGSSAICDEYATKDSRVRVFHKENGGLSSARNYGIDRAKGEYVIFVDSDDYWNDINALGHLYETAKVYNADVVRGEYISIDENGDRIKTITKNKKDIELKLLDSATFYTNAICGENFSWLYLFKRNAVGQLRFDEKRKFQEDIDFNIKFFSTPHKCVYTSHSFYTYRKRRNSIVTTPKIENLEGSFSLCDVFYEYSNLATDEKLKAEYYYNSIMMYYWTLDSITSDLYFSRRSEIIKKLGLKDLQKKVNKWSLKSSEKYPIIIKVSPIIGVWLLKLKHQLGLAIRKIINK